MDDHKFLLAVKSEIEKARDKFPMPNQNFVALIEEVGELGKAILEEPIENIRKEAVQVAVMAMRIAVEGDPDNIR